MSIDLSKTIEAKSDQLNADDLLGGPRVLTITAVKAGSADQPIIINYQGDQGKPWKPSKGMRRVLVAAWGPDGSAYIGRSVEVFNDQTVKWAGEAVGGIRISRMSDIKTSIVMALTLTRGKKSPVTIRPLEVAAPVAPPAKKELTIDDRRQKTIDMIAKAGVQVTGNIIETVNACATPAELKAVYEALTTKTEEVKA
jgi:hypothetical protein